MKNGDFAEIEYIGKIKQSGDIFDLTDENVAKENGLFNPKMTYGPITIVVGAKQILKGLDDALLNLNEGDEKTITIESKNAFGDRNPKLVRLTPMSHFKQQKMEPKQGQYITFEQGLRGKILSVTAGRVKIDFNHPLSGKELEYDVKVKKIITDTAKKLESLIIFYFGKASKKVTFTVKYNKAIISTDKKTPLNEVVTKRIKDDITKYIAEIKTIEFKTA